MNIGFKKPFSVFICAVLSLFICFGAVGVQVANAIPTNDIPSEEPGGDDYNPPKDDQSNEISKKPFETPNSNEEDSLFRTSFHLCHLMSHSLKMKIMSGTHFQVT